MSSKHHGRGTVADLNHLRNATAKSRLTYATTLRSFPYADQSNCWPNSKFSQKGIVTEFGLPPLHCVSVDGKTLWWLGCHSIPSLFQYNECGHGHGPETPVLQARDYALVIDQHYYSTSDRANEDTLTTTLACSAQPHSCYPSDDGRLGKWLDFCLVDWTGHGMACRSSAGHLAGHCQAQASFRRPRGTSCRAGILIQQPKAQRKLTWS